MRGEKATEEHEKKAFSCLLAWEDIFEENGIF